MAKTAHDKFRQPTVEELVEEQGVGPITDLSQLHDSEATKEEVDAFVAALEEPRSQGKLWLHTRFTTLAVELRPDGSGRIQVLRRKNSLSSVDEPIVDCGWEAEGGLLGSQRQQGDVDREGSE